MSNLLLSERDSLTVSALAALSLARSLQIRVQSQLKAKIFQLIIEISFTWPLDNGSGG